MGNHEHGSGKATPYYQYIGTAAGDPKLGYYSYDIGAWHAVVLNSGIVVNSAFSDAERTAQEEWLKKDLGANPKLCTVA